MGAGPWPLAFRRAVRRLHLAPLEAARGLPLAHWNDRRLTERLAAGLLFFQGTFLLLRFHWMARGALQAAFGFRNAILDHRLLGAEKLAAPDFSLQGRALPDESGRSSPGGCLFCRGIGILHGSRSRKD